MTTSHLGQQPFRRRSLRRRLVTLATRANTPLGTGSMPVTLTTATATSPRIRAVPIRASIASWQARITRRYRASRVRSMSVRMPRRGVSLSCRPMLQSMATRTRAVMFSKWMAAMFLPVVVVRGTSHIGLGSKYGPAFSSNDERIISCSFSTRMIFVLYSEFWPAYRRTRYIYTQ